MIAHVDVAVVGAGVTGLAAAWAAEQQGATVAVLEAAADCGGAIKSQHADGFLVERGATSMTGSAALMQVLRQLELLDEVVVPPIDAKRRFIVRNGKLCVLPSSPTALLSTSALSWRGKLRVLREPWVARSTIPPARESIAQLVRRRFGDEVLDYIVDPFISGVYAGDPEALSSRFALRVLSELEQQHGSILSGAIGKTRMEKASKRDQSKRDERTRKAMKPAGDRMDDSEGSRSLHDSAPHILSFRRGMQQLPRALEAALTQPVRYEHRVTDVSHRNSQWHVAAGVGADRQALTANALVLALPAHQMRAVSWPQGFASELGILHRLTHAAIATVSLGFHRTQIAHPLNGFGILAPHKEKRGILGALFNSSMLAERAPDSHVQITAFVGGARFQGALTNARAEQLSLSELTPLLGITGPPVMISSHVWHEGIPQFNLGHEAVDDALTRLEAAWSGLFFAGSYRNGVAVGECLLHGLEIGARAGTVQPNDTIDCDILAAAGPHYL